MSKRLYPMQGVQIWKNDKNGFTVFQLHYTADPSKRDPSYIKHIKESMPIRTFRQEYELEWDTFEGLPVYEDWAEDFHGVKADIAPQIGLPLLLGFDFGLTPACIVCQLQEEKLVCMKEFTAQNMGARRFLQWIKPQLSLMFPHWVDLNRDFLLFIDPSGEARKDTDEGSCAKELDSAGFKNIIPGPVAWEERKTSVEKFLTKRNKQGPCFQVSLPNCPILTRGFQGGYRYADTVLDLQPDKLRPLKDVHSHIHDALQMVTARILSQRRPSAVKIPTPFYSFTTDSRGFDNG